MRAIICIGLIVLLATACTVRGDANTVVGNLNVLAELSSQANTIASSISITNFFSTCPQLINQLQTIIQTESNDISAMQNNPPSSPLNAADQQAVGNAFSEYVQVSQQMLATIIGKEGLVSLTPFTQPIAAALRSLEGTTDTVAFQIIDMIPTVAQAATSSKNSLDQSLEQAITTYDGGVGGTGIGLGRRFL